MGSIIEEKFKTLIKSYWDNIENHKTNQLSEILAEDIRVRDVAKHIIMNKFQFIADAEQMSKITISVIRSQKTFEFSQTEQGLEAYVTFTQSLLVKPRIHPFIYQTKGHQKWLLKFENGKHVIQPLEILTNEL